MAELSFRNKLAREPAAVKPKLILFLLIIFIFFSLRLPFLFKEYAPEETAWVSAGEGVARTGFLWVYEGENSPNWAFWKPPGFPLVLGLFYKVFGSSEATSRIVGTLFALGQIILIYFLAKNIFSSGAGVPIGLIAAFLLAVNPFSVQNSVQVDIDGGPVAFFTLLMIFFGWRIFQDAESKRKNLLGLALSSTAALFFRLDTPAVVLTSLLLFFFIFRRQKSPLIIKLAIISLISAVLLTFGYYAFFGQTEKVIVIFKNIAGFFNSRATAGALENSYVDEVVKKIPLGSGSLSAFRVFIPSIAFFVSSFLWITLPLGIFLTIGLAEIIKQKLYREEKITFIVLPALAVTVFFIAAGAGGNFPRYLQSAMNPFYIFAGFLLTNRFRARQKTAIGIMALFLVFFTIFYSSIGEKLLFIQRPESDQIFAGLTTAAAVIIGILLPWFFKSTKMKFLLAEFLAAAYVTAIGFLLIHDLKTPTTLANYYGNYGYRAAAEYLKLNTRSGEKIWATDNIGYYYGGRYHNVFGWGQKEDDDTVYVAAYKKLLKRKPGITERKELIAVFGTVEIYKSSDLPDWRF